MSKKRKRRSGGRGRSSGHPAPRPASPAEERPSRPRGGGLFGGAGVMSPFPTVRETLLKGFFVVAGTPSLLLVSFLIVFATWVGLVYGGLELAPVLLVTVLAIPPFAISFDVGVGPALLGAGGGAMLLTVLTLFVRAIVIGGLVAIMAEVMERDEVSSDALGRAVRALPAIVAMNLVAFSLVAIGQILAAFVGPIAWMAALLVGLYFLAFVPAAAIREQRRPFDVLRRAARAARLPGASHLLLCTLYFLFVFLVQLFQPQDEGITANPEIATWLFVLAGTFVHLVFLAGFIYRWIEVEPLVPEQPIRRARR